MMNKSVLAVLVVSIAAVCAVAPRPAIAQPDYAALGEQLVDKIVAPGYAHFADRAKELEYEAKRHCKNTGDAPDMLALRNRFHDAMDAWQAVQHIRHGPVALEDRHARLQFWPDKRGITERHMRKLIAEQTADTFADDLSGSSVALQGFPALERLIFSDKPLSQKVQPGEKANRCIVVEAITRNIASIAAALNAGSTSITAGTRDGIGNMLGDLITGLQFIQSLKLKLPAGEKKPRPFLLENWRSARSLRNVEINIRALRELYKLLAAGADADDPQHNLILDQFDAAEDSVRAMGENGKVLLGEDLGPTRFRALAGTMETLRDLIAEYLTERLDVSLGFNSLDGD